MIYLIVYFLGVCLAGLAVPTLWIGFFLRSIWYGAIIGLIHAMLLTAGSYYTGGGFNIFIALACIIDGMFFGYLGKRFRKKKS